MQRNVTERGGEERRGEGGEERIDCVCCDSDSERERERKRVPHARHALLLTIAPIFRNTSTWAGMHAADSNSSIDWFEHSVADSPEEKGEITREMGRDHQRDGERMERIEREKGRGGRECIYIYIYM